MSCITRSLRDSLRHRTCVKKVLQQFSNFHIKANNLSSSVQKMTQSSYNYDSDAIAARITEYPIHPLLHSRTSPREMTGESISDEELMTLFEASRWAPSHYNIQPFRFVYAKRDTDHWPKFNQLLWPPNQNWCSTASALVIVVSQRYFQFKGENTLIPSNSYDAGAAWMSIALEGTARGFVVHGLGGFDYDKAYEVIKVSPETHRIEAMIAIGRRPAKELRQMNEKVTQRKPLRIFVSEGEFVDRPEDQ